MAIWGAAFPAEEQPPRRPRRRSRMSLRSGSRLVCSPIPRSSSPAPSIPCRGARFAHQTWLVRDGLTWRRKTTRPGLTHAVPTRRRIVVFHRRWELPLPRIVDPVSERGQAGGAPAHLCSGDSGEVTARAGVSDSEATTSRIPGPAAGRRVAFRDTTVARCAPLEGAELVEESRHVE